MWRRKTLFPPAPRPLASSILRCRTVKSFSIAALSSLSKISPSSKKAPMSISILCKASGVANRVEDETCNVNTRAMLYSFIFQSFDAIIPTYGESCIQYRDRMDHPPAHTNACKHLSASFPSHHFNSNSVKSHRLLPQNFSESANTVTNKYSTSTD